MQPQSKVISQRVALLRKWMKQRDLSAFIIPSTDPHSSEYVPLHWASREWISGFNGSAGIAVVTLTDAALWTDSRYFLAAAEQLQNTPFQLMKERVTGTPTIAQWLASVLGSNPTSDSDPTKVGIDGWVNSAQSIRDFRKDLEPLGITLETTSDPMATLWTDRPSIPTHQVELHPIEYAGRDLNKKLHEIRNVLSEQGADALIVPQLDDIAWTLNLRGSDVHCNPVFVAYLLIQKNTCTLYIQAEKLDDKVHSYLFENHIDVKPYETILSDLKNLKEEVVMLDPEKTNQEIYAAASSSAQLLETTSPIAAMKAVKCTAEINGFRQAMLRDGVAMVKFLCWLEREVPKGGITEMEVDRQLTSFRAEQSLFRGLSFDTIAAYGPHAAIVHYEATPKTDVPLEPRSFLLLDSGAQYQDGTTDITRTIPLGPLTEEEKLVYTLVLKGHIALSRLKFPSGASGTQLDLSARQALWEKGYNFGHGTGHGVGSFLCVHEGPHQIRQNYVPAPLLAGMTVTDEPGIYLPNQFGVRIENVLLVQPYLQTDFGDFLQFEPLTLCPIDKRPLLFELLNKTEMEWMDNYHLHVRQQLLPLLNDDETITWLLKATQPIVQNSTN